MRLRLGARGGFPIRAPPVLLIVLALVLSSAPALATWYGPGTYEPDTQADIDRGMMWREADASPDPAVRQVYFNSFPSSSFNGPNPNSGTLGTRMVPAGVVQHNAHLGVWKDCNDDGYIGLAESALMEYRAEALLSTAICPAGSAHNDGEWVYEILHILPDAGEDEYGTIRMESARIWGDIGLSGAQPAEVCTAYPMPHGTTSGTGHMIRFFDCLAGSAITSGVNGVDEDGSLGIRFDDADNPHQSDSLLNVHFPVNLFGNPTTGQRGIMERETANPAFESWDCSGEPVNVRDPTAPDDGGSGALRRVDVPDPVGVPELDPDGDGFVVRVDGTDNDGSIASHPAPAVGVNDAQGSYADGASAAYDGALGNCDPSDGSGYDGTHDLVVYSLDAPVDSTAQAPGKNAADMTFFSFPRLSMLGLTNQLGDIMLGFFGERTPRPLGEHTPGNLGIQAGSFILAPTWTAYETYTSDPHTPNIHMLGERDAGYFTFYAYLDPAELAAQGLLVRSFGTRTYGVENCEQGIGTGQPTWKGWVCDPAKWNVDSSGASTASPESAYVGDLYNLLDIDCYDMTLVRGVDASVADAVSVGGGCVDASA